ncbi:hypothetical protein [Candidatus Nanohalococcus occultus]|uniref:hypothetical protein n=1 Tax=Candidatus Nanohalococcus occultus TaxID=2978047 RepID=UPI0039DFDE34
MSKGDPHRLKQRLKNATQKIENSNSVSEQNTEVLLDFYRYLEEDGLSKGRIERPLTIWRIILTQGRENFKIDQPTEEDIKRVAKKILNGDREDEDLIEPRFPINSSVLQLDYANCHSPPSKDF